MNTIITTLRVITGLGLLLAAIAFGYFARSVWVIPLLAIIFNISFVLGRWQAWEQAAAVDGIWDAFKEQWKTYLVQLVMCSVFYLIGRGLNAVIRDYESVSFELLDVWMLLGLDAFAMIGGALIIILERKRRNSEALKLAEEESEKE